MEINNELLKSEIHSLIEIVALETQEEMLEARCLSCS
jgi:hypothetical protein